MIKDWMITKIEDDGSIRHEFHCRKCNKLLIEHYSSGKCGPGVLITHMPNGPILLCQDCLYDIGGRDWK